MQKVETTRTLKFIFFSSSNYGRLPNRYAFLGVNLQKGPSVADTVVGEGNTTAWKMCGLDKSTCLTVFFDLSSSDQSTNPGAVNNQLYIQFMTRYPLLQFRI